VSLTKLYRLEGVPEVIAPNVIKEIAPPILEPAKGLFTPPERKNCMLPDCIGAGGKGGLAGGGGEVLNPDQSPVYSHRQTKWF